MEPVILKAEKREQKEKANACRIQGMIPGVIYNHGKTEHLKFNGKEVKQIFSAGISESQLYSIEIGSKKEAAFIKDYQKHPVTSEILHLDFFRITYGEKVKTNLPVHVVGKSAGEKEGGVLETFIHDIEIEILPKDLVASIDVDISHLNIGDAIHANDLNLPESAKVISDSNPIICHVALPAKIVVAEVEETEAEAEETATEETTEKS